MAILTAPITGKEKDVENAFRVVAEAECPGVKFSVRFRSDYDGYSLRLEKGGRARDLFFHEIRLTNDHEDQFLIDAVKYEASSLEKVVKYPQASHPVT